MIKLKKQPKLFDPMKYLLDEKLILQAAYECLIDNDIEGVIEVLQSHFEAVKRKTIEKSLKAK